MEKFINEKKREKRENREKSTHIPETRISKN